MIIYVYLIAVELFEFHRRLFVIISFLCQRTVFRFTLDTDGTMGVQKKTRKFATVKRIIGQRDARLKKNQDKGEDEAKKNDDEVIREVYVEALNP